MSISTNDILYAIPRIVLRNVFGGSIAVELFDLIVKINRGEQDLDKQVGEAVQALEKSTQLISNLEDTLEKRSKKLNELRSEYERLSALTSLTKQQGDALVKQLENTVGKSQKKERVIAFIINLIAGLIIFIVGVFLSDAVKKIPTLFSAG